MYPPKYISNNLQHMLMDREAGWKRSNRHNYSICKQVNYEREFYRCIVPNLTIESVEQPSCYIRRFSPDGRYLIGYGNDHRTLHIYEYKGVGALAGLLQYIDRECIPRGDKSSIAMIARSEAFDTIFKLRHLISFASEFPIWPFYDMYYQLHNEFAIFIDNGRYILVGAITTKQSSHERPPDSEQPLLFGYHFFNVELKTGRIVDKKTFTDDNIKLINNHSVCIFDDHLAIFSKYRQCIHILKIVEGKMIEVQIIHQNHSNWSMSNPPTLRQRVYEATESHIRNCFSGRTRVQQLRMLSRCFSTYMSMIITKIQFIDKAHLLIRFEEVSCSTRSSNAADLNTSFYIFALYSWQNDEIVQVFANDSPKLIFGSRYFGYRMRNCSSLQTGNPSSAPSNNTYLGKIVDIILAHGKKEAALRFTGMLPISSQAFSTAYYLNYNMFKYNDCLISSIDRFKRLPNRSPISFVDRASDKIRFRFFFEVPPRTSSRNTSDNEIHFNFHPFEPFCYSMLRIRNRYVLNFHVRNAATKVKMNRKASYA